MEAKKAINLLTSKNCRSDFESLILEILKSREKLKQPSNASFYLRKGIESQKKRMNQLELEYENLRTRINSNTLTYFEELLAKKKADLNRWKQKEEIHICDRIAINALQTGVYNFESLIQIKHKYKHLKSLDFYLNNTVELVKLFE